MAKKQKNTGTPNQPKRSEMSLNDIQLLPRQIAELYENVLIETPAQAIPDTSSISYLGGNAQHILILVHRPDQNYLPETELSFLKNVLSACGLTLADVAIVNRSHYTPVPFMEFLNAFSPKNVLLFEVSPQDIGLPVHFLPFQVQSFDGRMYLAAPSLTVLEHDKPKKKELWSALKRFFYL